MGSADFDSMFPLVVLAFLVLVSYELSIPNANSFKRVSGSTEKHPADINLKSTAIAVRQRVWAEKAVKRYAEAQEKKWRNWNEAMFEPIKLQSK